MRFNFLAEQIHDLRMCDYERFGLKGNPAYCELHRGDDVEVHVPRKALESAIRDAIDKFTNGEDTKHIYMYSREGGAGKSQTNKVMKDYCREKKIPFIDWNGDDEPEDIVRAIEYLIHLADIRKAVFFRECDAERGFYAKLLPIKNLLIIGHGHEPERELDGANDKFDIFDLDEDYPFSKKEIEDLIREYIKQITEEPILEIPDKAIKRISESTVLPGAALNMLGAMLAVAIFRAKKGEELRITDEDIELCCDTRIVEALANYHSS